MKQEALTLSLLTVASAIIRTAPREDSQTAAASASPVDDLAYHILTARLKLLYSYLASEKAKANAALHLLGAIVGRGARLTAELCKRFDFELPALYKLARAPRSGNERASLSTCLLCETLCMAPDAC